MMAFFSLGRESGGLRSFEGGFFFFFFLDSGPRKDP
jgi:hypothetical protein